MKIKFAPYQPHCFAFGGFELQMLSAFEAIQECGGLVSKLDPWERSDNFEILHCWGLGLPHEENIYWAKRSQKKIVVTTLLPYYEFLNEKLRFLISSYFRKNYFLLKMSESVDAFIVLNDIQAEICHRYFKVPDKKIHIIPNIVNEKFFANDSNDSLRHIFNEKHGLRNYVLTTGNVCTRKNQLNLAKACIQEGVRLVIVGKPLMGEDEYILEMEKICLQQPNIIWIKGLPENSPELISAYMNCSVFALPSHIENQPICLLEAVVMRKPLLIADRAYARQSYYSNSCLVDPDDARSIAQGLKKIMNDPLAYTPSLDLVSECNSKNIGKKYLRVYGQMMNT